MRIERLREFARAAPFEPFRIFLSNGSNWLAPHPDFVFFSKDVLIVTGVPHRRGGTPRTVTCEPLHVTHVEIAERS